MEEIRALRAKLISTESELELSLVRDTERRLNEQNSVRELKAQLALSRETVENLVKRIGHLEAIGTATPTVAECDEEISVMKNDESKVPNFQVEVETTRVLLRFFRSHSSFLLTQLQSSLDNVRWFHQTSASHTTIVARLKDAKAEVNSLLKNIDQLEQQCNSSAADNNSSHLPDEVCLHLGLLATFSSHNNSLMFRRVDSLSRLSKQTHMCLQ